MKLNIVMVEPEIPQNTGNIARTCAITGAKLHLVHPLGFKIDEKSVKRAGLDYWDKLDIEEHKSLDDFLNKYRPEENNMFFATTKGTTKYTDIDYSTMDEVFVLYGKETKGLPETLLEKYLDEKTISQLISEDYSRMVISVNADYEGQETFDLIQKIRDIASEYYPNEYYLAGEGVSTYDLMNTVMDDMLKVNMLAIGAVFLVLLVSLHSISLPVILVLSIETAIWLNLSVPYFMDTTIFYIAYLIISSIQLGATVDYAILMTDRYKENRQSFDKKQAVVQTISDVTVSILTSGSVLTVVGLLMGYISTNQLLAQLGLFIGRGTIFSLAIVLFVLPGLLYLFDRLIVQPPKHKIKHTRKQNESKEQEA